MAKIVVTGVSGFVGKHVVRELIDRKCQVVGVGYSGITDASLKEKLEDYIDCDLTDPKMVANLPLSGVSGIINLAGLASVGDSFKNAEVYKRINVQVLTTLCERLLRDKLSIRVIAVSSGSVYDANQAMPLTETSKLAASGSPYAISKILMEEEAQRFIKKGLDCVVTRPFNHSGPGQLPGFLIPDLYQKIRQAAENNGVIEIGNLSTKRDYTDVRDVAKAYADLVLAPKPLRHSVYNVCSGKSRQGQDILDLMLEITGQQNSINIKQNPELFRPSDSPDLYGSYQRLHEEMGWQPTIPFEQTLRDFIASA